MAQQPERREPSRRSAPVLGRILRRSVLREMVVPTGIAWLGLTILALTKNVLGYADLIVNRGLGPDAVAGIAFHQALPLSLQVLPFAGLVGSLVGLGRLKMDLELLSIEGAGVAPTRLVGPALAFGVLLAGLGLAGSLWAAPWARARLETAVERMAFEHPGALLRAGRVHRFGERQLLAREVSSRGDQLRGVLLWEPAVGETIFADAAAFAPRDGRVIDVVLERAVVLTAPSGGGSHFETARFATELEDPGTESAPETSGVETASTGWLATLVRTPSGGSAARVAETELQRRLALPSASILFGLLAPPLAFVGRRFSRSSGGVTGLLVTIAWYGLVQLGNGLLRYENVPVAAAVWLPHAVALGAATVLLWPGRLRSTGSGERSPRRRRARVRRTGPWRPRRRPLDRYVGVLFVEMALVSFAGILVAYLAIDVLERLQWLAQHRAEPAEVLRYYAARIPLLASRVVPMSLLAATALTVSGLSTHRELVAMQSCGVSLARGLAPVLFLAAVLVPADFLLNDAVVPRANEWADRVKNEEIKDQPEARTVAGSSAIWYRVGEQIMRASKPGIDRGEVRDLTVYELDPQGFPRSRTDAREARRTPDGAWELVGATRIAISDAGVEQVEPPSRLRFEDAASAAVDPAHVGVRILARAIRQADLGGYDTTAWRVDLHARLAAPLACLLLPLLVLLWAVRAPGPLKTSRSLLAAGGLGVGYILVSDVATSLGYGGRLPPELAGWGPPLALVATTPILLWRGRR